MTTNTAYPVDVALCHELLQQQAATLVALQAEMEQLKQYIAWLRRQQFGRRSEQADRRQMALFEEPPELDAQSSTQQVDDGDSEENSHRKRRRSGGRNKLPAHLPRQRIEHDLAEHERACTACGCQRQHIGCDTSEELEYIPASFQVIEHVRHKYACPQCEGQVQRVPVPARILPKALPGPGLLSTIVVHKFVDHLPLYRLERIFARHGVYLSRSTLCRWLAEVAEQVLPLVQWMTRRLLQSRVIHTDDTPILVQDPRLPECRRGYLWAYVGDTTSPYCVYDFTENRQRAGPLKFLGDYRGFLQADAFAGYNSLYAAGRVQQVLCWAHARRKFFDAQTVQPALAHTALAYIRRLYAVERQAQTLLAKSHGSLSNPTAREAWYAARRELRQTQSLPILSSFHTWLTAIEPSILPKSPLGRALHYVLPRWSGLTRYCDHGFLSIDNNLSEGLLRACALGRKNYLFFGSPTGGRTASILYSLTQTCHYLQVCPHLYLQHLLTHLPLTSDLPTLLPDTYLTLHPTSSRPR